MTPSSPASNASHRARRDAVAARWALDRGAVLVASGLPVPIAGTDQAHDFTAHPEHYYLAGLAHPGGILAFDPDGGWTLFVHQASREDQVWTNASEAPEMQAARSGIDRVRDRSVLANWLERRRGEPVALLGNHDFAHNPAAYGIENWPALELDIDDELSARLSQSLSEARRAKDPGELDLMRAAARASIAGHRAGLRLLPPPA